jgi:hypothetical protein
MRHLLIALSEAGRSYDLVVYAGDDHLIANHFPC